MRPESMSVSSYMLVVTGMMSHNSVAASPRRHKYTSRASHEPGEIHDKEAKLTVLRYGYLGLK